MFRKTSVDQYLLYIYTNAERTKRVQRMIICYKYAQLKS